MTVCTQMTSVLMEKNNYFVNEDIKKILITEFSNCSKEGRIVAYMLLHSVFLYALGQIQQSYHITRMN